VYTSTLPRRRGRAGVCAGARMTVLHHHFPARGPGRGAVRVRHFEAVVPVSAGASGRYNGTVGWEQVMTVVAAVALTVPAAALYNNRRFDDVHRRIDDLRADMNARFAQVDARLTELREDLREIRGMLQEALRTRAP